MWHAENQIENLLGNPSVINLGYSYSRPVHNAPGRTVIYLLSRNVCVGILCHAYNIILC